MKMYVPPTITVMEFKIGVFGDYGNPDPKPFRGPFNVLDNADNQF